MESKTLKKVIYFLLALTPLTLWFVSDGKILGFIDQPGENGLFFPFISGKNLLFRALVDVAFVCWLLLIAEERKYGFHKTAVAASVYVFMGVILIADIFAVNVRSSLFSGFERMEGFVGLVHYLMYFIVLSSVLKTKEEWSKISRWFFASSFLVSLYAFFQFLGHPDVAAKMPKIAEVFSRYFPIHQGLRLDSTLGNPSYYAIFAVYIIGLSFYAILEGVKKRSRVMTSFAVFSVVVHSFLLMYTGTRGAVLGLLAGVLVAASIYLFDKKKFLIEWGVLLTVLGAFGISLFMFREMLLPLFYSLLAITVFMSGKALFSSSEQFKKVVATLFTIVIGSVFLLTFNRNSDFVQNQTALKRATNLSFSDGTVNSRFMVWGTSFEGFKEKPILGWGQDNFPYVFAKHQNPEMYSLEPWYDRSHNVFFDWLIAGGILGLLAHLALYVSAVYLTHKTETFAHSERSIIYGVLVAQFVHNLFIFDNLASYMFFYALLAYISAMYVLGKHDKKDKDNVDHKLIAVISSEQVKWTSPLLIILTVILCFQAVIFPYFANAAAIRGMANYSGDPLTVMRTKREGFESAVQLGSVGQREIREQYVEMAYQILNFDIRQFDAKTQSLLSEEQQKWYENVLTLADQDLKKYPNDLRVLELYGMFYLQTQDMAKAEKALMEAHKIAPMRQRTSINLLQLYLIKGDLLSANQLAKDVYTLTPKYETARKAYVAVSYRFGATDKFASFDEAIAAIHAQGEKIPYPTSLKSELVGISDVKVLDVYLDTLKADYPEKIDEINAFRKTKIEEIKELQKALISKK